MAYTNSSLVVFTKISPNQSGTRNHSIDRISPHCVVGQCNIESLGAWFAQSAAQASSNYGIGKDGRIGLFVPESNRSWCTSSAANDNRAVTIECASDTYAPYAMTDAVYQSLIKLCTDICRRNGKKKLLWFNDKNKSLNYNPAADEMVITVHRWFAQKSCPGDFLYNRLGDLALKVTSALGGSAPTPAPTPTTDPEAFIKKIAPIVQKIAPKYKLYSYSAIIAQACLESAYGTSAKAQRHNYFGLKYRDNRVNCSSGSFTDTSKEQNPDGSYKDISTKWFAFENMEKGVEGYCQFVNISNYKALKGVTDAKKYLEAIKSAGYATSISYVNNVMAVVQKYNLTKYDPIVYKAHVQNIGWQEKVIDGAWAGTQGEAKRLEALVIDPPEGVVLDVDVHLQNIGWRSYLGIKHNNDRILGTVGESRRVEAIKIRCTQNNTGRKLWYQVHCESYGTMKACGEGELAGTTGKSKRLEAIRICME